MPKSGRARALPNELELELGLDDASDPASLRTRVARTLGVPLDELPEVALRKRSLDARRGRVRFHAVVAVAPVEEELGGTPPREVRGEPRVVIVGEGPAGLFCGYELARRGIATLLVERGKSVQPRRRDLRALNRFGT